MIDDGTPFAAKFIEATGGDVVPISSPSGQRVVEIDDDDVLALKNLVSRMNDMNEVVDYCNSYIGVMSSTESTEEVRRALWKSAVTSYGRAFSRDTRKLGVLDLSALDGLPGNPRRAHAYFMQLRNKFIAHSDSSLESVVVGVELANDRQAIGDLLVVHIAAQLLVDEGAATLATLARAFLEWAKPISSRLQNEILARTRRVPLDLLYRRADATYRMPLADE
jgi:hypothetical protein